MEACFGPHGCPNRIVEDDRLVQMIEDVLADENLRGFLEETVKGPLKFHHEFRVSLAATPDWQENCPVFMMEIRYFV